MTVNPPAVSDPETFTVRRTIQISAPAERVWDAVTEPDSIARWFGRPVLVGQGVGAHGTIAWPGEPALPIRVEAIDPPRSITYRWSNGDTRPVPDTVDAGPSTTFTFTLEPTPDGTRLTVEETGFESNTDPLRTLEEHRQGWGDELDNLVRLLEEDAR